jgi:hypothetical protein
MRLRPVLTFAALVTIFVAASSMSPSRTAASSNDSSANRAVTRTSGTVTGTTFYSTRKAGKPGHGGNADNDVGDRQRSTRARPAPSPGAPTGIRGRHHERRALTGVGISAPGPDLRVRPRDPGGAPAKRVAVVCVLAALMAAGTANAYTLRPGFERAAAALGARAAILCQSAQDHARLAENLDGRSYITNAGTWRIELAPTICAALQHPGTAAAEAAAVLAHELGHVVRGSCELAAETFAMQNWARLYRLLGLGEPTPDGRALVRADHNALPARYRVGSCPRSA